MFNDLVFQPGDQVICQAQHDYRFTLGKTYTVIEYEPRTASSLPNFTWPAYVQVIDDEGRQVKCHASRFIPKE